MADDESEVSCEICGRPRWRHHYFAGFGLLGGNGSHVYKSSVAARRGKTYREPTQ